MPGSYTHRRINALRERGKRMANARWKRERERRKEEMPDRIRELAMIETENLPRKQGDPLGCLIWKDYRTGKITKRVVEIGDRTDRICIRKPDGTRSRSHGWTWFLEHFRKAICQCRL